MLVSYAVSVCNGTHYPFLNAESYHDLRSFLLEYGWEFEVVQSDSLYIDHLHYNSAGKRTLVSSKEC